jgi:hypothetical protein
MHIFLWLIGWEFYRRQDTLFVSMDLETTWIGPFSWWLTISFGSEICIFRFVLQTRSTSSLDVLVLV